MATPVLEDLHHNFPQAKISVLCQPAIGALLAKDPHINEILRYQKPNSWIHRAEHGDVIMPLRRGEYDTGLLLTNSFSSAWWLWRGHIPRRIGFTSPYRWWLLTDRVNRPTHEEHLVITYKRLLAPLSLPISSTLPKLYISSEETHQARQFLQRQLVDDSTTLIGINPGAAYGSAKCWLPERFREVTKRLIQRPNTKVIFFGDSTGASLVQHICQGLPANVIDMAGKTSLRELMALTYRCKAFLSNDSGPMHIASALGIPLVALFGSTNAYKTGPYNGGTVIQKAVSCSPCYQRTCPIDFRCMTQISVDEVYEAIIRLLP